MDGLHSQSASLPGEGVSVPWNAVAQSVGLALGGNRCGHDPARPRCFSPPERHQDRPRVLRKLEEKLRAYFESPRKTIPTLDLANGKDRRQRSERREACVALLGCMIHYLDLVTLRVGIPAIGGFKGLTMACLAGQAGVGLRRAERAMADLVKAGLVKVYPLCERKDDLTFKGYAAIRTIPATLFALFGLGRWLIREREKASKRLRDKRRLQDEAELAKVKLALGTLMEGKCPASQNPQGEPTTRHGEGLKGPLEYLAHMKALLRGKDSPPPA
jgi:hypothetical protein